MLEYDRIDVSKGSDVNKTTIVMLVTFFDFSLQHLMIVIILHIVPTMLHLILLKKIIKNSFLLYG